jgi:D-psicose/D-tagatose/L-ribulose 3-epimerase
VAVGFFSELAATAEDCGVVLCIEPNPPDYGCDYVTTSAEGTALVQSIDRPGFGLHLDTGALTLSGESPPAALRAAAPVLRHFHASERDLAPLGTRGVVHAEFAAALASVGYGEWVSLEMRRVESDPTGALQRALRVLRENYGDT